MKKLIFKVIAVFSLAVSCIAFDLPYIAYAADTTWQSDYSYELLWYSGTEAHNPSCWKDVRTGTNHVGGNNAHTCTSSCYYPHTHVSSCYTDTRTSCSSCGGSGRTGGGGSHTYRQTGSNPVSCDCGGGSESVGNAWTSGEAPIYTCMNCGASGAGKTTCYSCGKVLVTSQLDHGTCPGGTCSTCNGSGIVGSLTLTCTRTYDWSCIGGYNTHNCTSACTPIYTKTLQCTNASHSKTKNGSTDYAGTVKYINLTEYIGTATDVKVPSSAVVGGLTYQTVIAPSFTCSGVINLDLSEVDMSLYTSGTGSITDSALFSIKTPKNVKIDISLPKTYYDASGVAYTKLPKNNASSIELVDCYLLNVSAQTSAFGTLCGVVSGSSGPTLANEPCQIDVTPNRGFRFLGWYEGATLVCSTTSYSFTMPEGGPLTLVAKFAPLSYTPAVSIDSALHGSVSCDKASQLYEYPVTVTATTEPGYTFDGWYETSEVNSDVKVSSDATYSFSMPYYNVSLVAKYTVNKYDMQVAIEEARRGTVEVVSGSGLREYRSPVTIKATATQGFSFEGWYDNSGEKISSEASFTFIMPYRDYTLTAKYVKNPYRLDVAIDDVLHGAVTVISGNAINIYEDTIEVECSTKPGYTFDGWYDQYDTKLSSNAHFTFSMTNYDLVLTAKYTVNSYFITAFTDHYDYGSVRVLDGREHLYRTMTTVHAVPKQGFNFAGWYLVDSLGNETLASTDAIYVFETPHEDVKLRAEFVVCNFIFTPGAPNIISGSVQFSPSGGSLPFGTPITATASPNDGYVFIGWYDENDNLVSTDMPYTFTMPAKDFTLVAVFKQFTAVEVSLNSAFWTAYGKAPYYNGYSFDVSHPITLTKDHLDVYAVFDNGSRERLANSAFSLVTNAINIVGSNVISINGIVNNVTRTGALFVSGYSDVVSDALQDVIDSLGVTDGDYSSLRDKIDNMYQDLDDYRTFVSDIDRIVGSGSFDMNDASAILDHMNTVTTSVGETYARVTTIKAALNAVFTNGNVDVNSVSSIMAEITRLQSELSDFLDQLAEFEGKVAELTLKEEELNAQIMEQLAIQNERKEEYDELVRQLSAAQADLGVVNEQLATVNSSVTNYQNQISSSQDEIDSYQLKLMSIQDSYSAAAADLDGYRAKITELNALKSQYSQAIESSKEQLEAITLEVEALAEEKGIVVADSDDLMNVVDELIRIYELNSAYISEGNANIVDSISHGSMSGSTGENYGGSGNTVHITEEEIEYVEYIIRQQFSTTTETASTDLNTLLLILEDAGSQFKDHNNSLFLLE